jgi:hypothetical protein
MTRSGGDAKEPLPAEGMEKIKAAEKMPEASPLRFQGGIFSEADPNPQSLIPKFLVLHSS